jgi:hypothetical protein
MKVAQRIWAWVKWLLPTLLFLIPVLFAGYYQARDLLGMGPLPSTDTLTKWMLGLLTLWLTSQGLQAIFFERPGQRVEDQLEQRFDDLSERVNQIVVPRLALCHTRKETFEALARLLADAHPPSATQKYVYMTYFSHAYPDLAELDKDFKREQERKLQEEQGWTWRHLWAVESPKKLADLRKDLERFNNVPGYLVRVLPALPPPFMLEMYVVAGNDALFSIPSERRASAVEISYHFKDKESVEHLKNYFDLLWQKGRDIKTNEGVVQDAIQELEKELQQTGITREIEITLTAEQTYHGLIQTVRSAHSTIDIASHNPSDDLALGGIRADYYDALDEVCQTNRVRIRRLALLHDMRQMEFIKSRMRKLKEAPFYVACFVELHHMPPAPIPMINCLLKDGEEVHIGHHWLANPDLDDYDLTLHGENVAQLFSGYYDYLWGKAIILKDRHGINENKIAEIEQLLSSARNDG